MPNEKKTENERSSESGFARSEFNVDRTYALQTVAISMILLVIAFYLRRRGLAPYGNGKRVATKF
jgi:hypothetical protein